jgi:hypothetical protein
MIRKAAHAQLRYGLMWKTMRFRLVIAMVAIIQFSQTVHSCGFINDGFSCSLVISLFSDVISTAYLRPFYRPILG